MRTKRKWSTEGKEWELRYEGVFMCMGMRIKGNGVYVWGRLWGCRVMFVGYIERKVVCMGRGVGTRCGLG